MTESNSITPTDRFGSDCRRQGIGRLEKMDIFREFTSIIQIRIGDRLIQICTMFQSHDDGRAECLLLESGFGRRDGEPLGNRVGRFRTFRNL